MKKLKTYIYISLWALFASNCIISAMIIEKGHPIAGTSYYLIFSGIILLLSQVVSKSLNKYDKIINAYMEESKGFL